MVISALCIARIQHMIGQYESALMWYMRAYEMDTERPEALKGIIKISKQLDMFNVGLWAGEKAIKMRKIGRTPQSKLFYEGNNIDEYTLMDIGLCAYYANPQKKTHCEASVDGNNAKRKRCNERESGEKKFRVVKSTTHETSHFVLRNPTS